MATKLVPSVRMWRMPNNPDTICFASYHAKNNKHRTRSIQSKIEFVYEPLRPEQKERFRAFEKEIIEELGHLPNGGGVLAHIKIRASRYFDYGQIYGLGKCLDLATVDGHVTQGNARAKAFTGGSGVEDQGRMSIGENSRFYWIEKAGETKEYTRKVHYGGAGKLWFDGEDPETSPHSPTFVGMGLRG